MSARATVCVFGPGGPRRGFAKNDERRVAFSLGAFFSDASSTGTCGQ